MSAGLGALFVGSLLASTLVPGGVEGLLVLLVQQETYGLLSLFLVATVGNTLGGIITFCIGVLFRRGLDNERHPRLRKWFSLDSGAVARVRRHGAPILLLSWMPLIGDPLCLAGGFIGLRFWLSAWMIALGKAARYLVLLWILETTL